jgi:MipA family protein
MIRTCLVCIGALALTSAHAELKPQWELGFGASAIAFPEYRGSDKTRGYAFPLPYFVWRSERIIIDKDSVRSKLFNNDVMELNFSVHGSVPIKSDDSPTRKGMPDLDATLEIGPSINTTLYRNPERTIHLQYKLPARFVVASDFKQAKSAGWATNPQLAADFRNIWGTGIDAGILGGPVIQSRRNHQYWYGVDPAFATNARPAYQAKGGYAGTNLIVGASKRMDRWWLAGFVRHDFLNGAKFVDSPLVKNKSYTTAGISLTYIFAESAKKVDVTD